MNNEAQNLEADAGPEASEYSDLLSVIGDDGADEPNYWGRYYWRWENHTATPRLEKLGYEVHGWWAGDGDSFGPLTRFCMATKDGEVTRFIYG